MHNPKSTKLPIIGRNHSYRILELTDVEHHRRNAKEHFIKVKNTQLVVDYNIAVENLSELYDTLMASQEVETSLKEDLKTVQNNQKQLKESIQKCNDRLLLCKARLQQLGISGKSLSKVKPISQGTQFNMEEEIETKEITEATKPVKSTEKDIQILEIPDDEADKAVKNLLATYGNVETGTEATPIYIQSSETQVSNTMSNQLLQTFPSIAHQNVTGTSQDVVVTSQNIVGTLQNVPSTPQSVATSQRVIGTIHNVNCMPQNIATLQNTVGMPQNTRGMPQNVATLQNIPGTPQNIIGALHNVGIPQSILGVTQNVATPQSIVGTMQNIATPQNIIGTVQNIATPLQNVATPQNIVGTVQNVATPQNIIEITEVTDFVIPEGFKPTKYDHTLEKINLSTTDGQKAAKRFFCLKCMKKGVESGYTKRNDLTKHLEGCGTVKEKKFKCTYENCKESYIRVDNLRQHVARVHTKEFLYSCKKCKKGFFMSREASFHRRACYPNKPEPGHTEQEEEDDQKGEPNEGDE